MTFITTFEQSALERGHAQGLSQGLSQGLEQGLSRGLQTGWTQALRSLVGVRFPDWNPAWDPHLDSIQDVSRFRECQRLAMTLPTAREFLRAIGKAEG